MEEEGACLLTLVMLGIAWLSVQRDTWKDKKLRDQSKGGRVKIRLETKEWMFEEMDLGGSNGRGKRQINRLKLKYEEQFASATIEELISGFNSVRQDSGFVDERSAHLSAIRRAFLDSGVDCSSFISGSKVKNMSMSYPIRLEGNAIVQVSEVEE